MKNTILVNLVSDQTLPNVQFIKWYFKENPENLKVLFISTKKMEEKQKSDCIKKALSSLNKFIEWETIQTDENDLNKTCKLLENYFEKSDYKKTVVNITGGTKLMSLAVFNFFNGKDNCKIYYQPIGKSLQELYPEAHKYDIFELLTLEEYLYANGITFSVSNECVKDWNFNKSAYDLYIKENRADIAGLVALQNTSYFKNVFKRKNFLDLTEVEEEKFLVKDFPIVSKERVLSLVKVFGFDEHKIENNQIRYITGGWFEEYVYQKICREYENVDEKNVALNVHIQKGNDKNELDVIYLDKDNLLHVIECKSFVDGKEGQKVLNDALYKLQAIIKSKFGLNVKQHLYTKSIIEKETPLNRAKEFGIQITDGKEL